MKNIRYSGIAKQANISKQFLSNILAGRKRPSWSTAKRLAEVTNSSPVDWMEASQDALCQIIDSVSDVKQ